MNSRFAAGILIAMSLGACTERSTGDASAATGGTIVIATPSDPRTLFPPAALEVSARQGTELIYEYLADVGPSMNTLDDAAFVKELASSWKWGTDSSSITFVVNPKATWQDGKPVTSRDVAFSFQIYTDTAVASNGISELSDIDSVTTPDRSSATFWFSRRTSHQFYDAASLMLILPEHIFGPVGRDTLRAFAARTNPVGSGKYRLIRWDRGSRFELASVKNHYRGAAGIDRLIWTVTPDYQSSVTRLLGGEVDVLENVRNETLPDLRKGGTYNLVSLPGLDYVFMRFNLRAGGSGAPHPLFASRDLRRAISMSIDRYSIVKNLFDTLGSVGIGPTVRAYPSTDTAIAAIPFNPDAAGRILDSLGWQKLSGRAIRAKAGKPLRFKVLVPTSSLTRMRVSVMIQEQLRQQGIDMQIEQMDLSAFNSRQEKRTFDAAIGGWHLGSNPGGVRNTWTSAAAGKGGLNYGSYKNASFDALIDSALAARTISEAREHFQRANQIIVDDAPAVWLYEPRTLLAVHRRIRVTAMRPSAWWVDMGAWKIPADERISRDGAVLSR